MPNDHRQMRVNRNCCWIRPPLANSDQEADCPCTGHRPVTHNQKTEYHPGQRTGPHPVLTFQRSMLVLGALGTQKASETHISEKSGMPLAFLGNATDKLGAGADQS